MKQVGPKTSSPGPVKPNVKFHKDRLHTYCNLLLELGKKLSIIAAVVRVGRTRHRSHTRLL